MSDCTTRGVDRRSLLRGVGAVGAVTTLTGGLSACGGPASTAGGAGRGASTIEAGISYALSTGFDPMLASGATPVAANMHIFEGLVDLDPVKMTAAPALATDMPRRVDATTYRATLREGATFHDGSPVTAEDVVFSFERVLDPENASLFAQFLPFIDKVRAVDERTVEFSLGYEFPLFPSRICVTKIVPKKLVEADSKGFDAKPVGSGPYRLVRALRQDKIVMARYDDYNGPHPARADNLVWRLMVDPSARVSAMYSGRIQAIEDVPYVDLKGLKRKAKIESVSTFGQLFMMFNCARKPFDDKRVRQALHYALDTEKVIGTAMLGNGNAATGYLQEAHPDYHRAATVYGHDPDRARELLAEAGAENLRVEILTTDTGWVKDSAPVIKESLDAVGLRTTLSIAQSAAQYSKVDKGDYDVLVAPGDPSVFGNDVDLLLRWYFEGVWPEKRFRWKDSPQDKKVRSLLDEAARSGEDKHRRKLWGQVTDLIADEVPLYPILHRELPTAWDDEALAGFQPLPMTGLSFLDVGRA